ncbi:MAG: hypothetical protein ACKO66_04625 [Flavobacteriales bacterium]
MGHLSHTWYRLKKKLKAKKGKQSSPKTKKTNTNAEAVTAANYAVESVEVPAPIQPINTSPTPEPIAEQPPVVADTNAPQTDEAFLEEHGFDLNQMAMIVNWKQWTMIREQLEAFISRPYYVSKPIEEYAYLDMFTCVARIIKSEKKRDAAGTMKLVEKRFKHMGKYILANIKMSEAPANFEDYVPKSWKGQESDFEIKFNLSKAFLEFQVFAVRYICEKYPKYNRRSRFMDKNLKAGSDLLWELTTKRLAMEYMGSKW